MLYPKKVLILEPIDGMETSVKILKDHGIEIIYGRPVSEVNKPYSEEEVIDMAKDVNAILGMAREKITRKIIESSKNLQVICKYGIGVDNIDVKAATENGVIVTNAPVHSSTVAEATITLMLSVLKKTIYNEKHLRNGKWRDSTTLGRNLSGKTIGILGFGRIGKELALRLQGWNVKILVSDTVVEEDQIKDYNAKLVSKETLLKKSDIISLHLPFSNLTKNLISRKEFSIMKNTSVIINTSRGGIINEEELIYAIKTGEIGGAGLDVFSKEPVSLKSELLNFENIIMLPHVAGYTHEALYEISMQASINCLEVLEGNIPKYTVNLKELKKI